MEISLNDGEYINVERQSHNRFIADVSNPSSLKVKIISISGEEIICPTMSGIIEGVYDCKKQFSSNHFFDLYSRTPINEKKLSECCKKPSLITDLSKCKVDTNYVDPDPYVPPKSNANNLKIFFLFFLLISYLF